MCGRTLRRSLMVAFVASGPQNASQRRHLVHRSRTQPCGTSVARLQRRGALLMRSDGDDEKKRSGDLFVPVFALTAIIGYSLIIAYDFFRTADLGGFEWIGK
mmetsp:Transcript_4074/g.12242  ORF Transcript_4074/g.12242 Transcript_4074/m.12242 type:complete len:102 (-) Transcript_4074:680-985(-)